MAQLIITIIATALLSSLLTLAIAQYVFNKKFKNQYESGLAKAIEQFKQEVGPEIEARVKQGVLEGIKSLPSKEILRDTTRSIAKTGLDIVGDGLKMATRPRPSGSSRRPPYDKD